MNMKNLKLFSNKVKPKTGRHHQIRVQLSSIGCKIKILNMELTGQMMIRVFACLTCHLFISQK